ncbi:sialidase family protein [Lignipirellula cremea]|uniref:Sialidase A n=1 Tax=Lignipirellula cremea TaxID=2528010 RepID=A0A518DSP2_9BACT|nr:sialidase family protein [Lignipirellula cremea]QDU94856.1 Sialidase A precursor [Lignipirellula cremea]
MYAPRPFLTMFVLAALALTAASVAFGQTTVTGKVRDGVQRITLLPPGPGNPRNSESDMIRLKDGRLLLIYTHFTGGAGDHATAHLAGRISNDAGQSWTAEDQLILPNEGGQNIMSVSLLRLADGRIALFYLRKNSPEDCRPVMRTSDDEAQTWSEPIEVIPAKQLGSYVLNNDRAVQLKSGRLILPLAQHNGLGWKGWTSFGRILCYYSDDNGKSWRRGETAPAPDDVDGKQVRTQEPGVIALKNNDLLLWCRTDAGSQYIATSTDSGVHWSQLQPSKLLSPLSPATIEPIPTTGHWLLVWNDHRGIAAELKDKRTPLRAAISTDEGKSWSSPLTLEDNPHGWYCYTAMDIVDGAVVLAHCAGDRRATNGLALTQVTRFPVRQLYTAGPEQP